MKKMLSPSLMTLLLVLGCAEDAVPTGVESVCSQVCELRVECEGTSDQDSCLSECQQEYENQSSNSCQAVFLEVMGCLSNLTCDDVGSADALFGCMPTDGATECFEDSTETEPAEPDDREEIPETYDPLNFEAIGSSVLIQGGFIFTEGPAWDPATETLLFSDIEGDTIYRLELPNTFTTYRTPSGRSNGLAFDNEGRLLIAGHSSRKMVRVNEDGTDEILAEIFDGKALNSPNDIAVHSSGAIYFTDPEFGLGGAPADQDAMGVYRIDESGELTRVAAFTDSPNGIALSPDESMLYVAHTFGFALRAFDVQADGTLANERQIASPNYADGMAVDVAGNLYVTSFDGVNVYDATGRELGIIEVAEIPANCGFGGPNNDILFITARTSLYQVTDMPIPGLR